jgi:hypothetical protein
VASYLRQTHHRQTHQNTAEGPSVRRERALFVLILADVLLSLVSIAGAEPPPGRLPGLVWLFVVGSTLAAWMGLLWRLRAARTLYLVSWLAYLRLTALHAPASAGGPGEAVQLLMALNGGAILALAWLSDLGGRFVTLGEALGSPSGEAA